MCSDARPTCGRRRRTCAPTPFEAEVEVDGKEWYEGHASCVLFGNVGEAFAGVKAFKDAHPDDGLLDIGVASADGVSEWGRTLARSALSDVRKSPFVHVTKGQSVAVKLSRKVLYELDGGDRAEEEDVPRRHPAGRGHRLRSSGKGVIATASVAPVAVDASGAPVTAFDLENRSSAVIASRAPLRTSTAPGPARLDAGGERFLNRELSWLDFNRRVLELAADDEVPLLERVKLLSIVASNLDEFFAVRMARLEQRVASGNSRPFPDGRTPLRTLVDARRAIRALLAAQDRFWLDELRPALAARAHPSRLARGVRRARAPFAEETVSARDRACCCLRRRSLPGRRVTSLRWS